MHDRIAEISETVEGVVLFVREFLSDVIMKELPPGQMLLESNLEVGGIQAHPQTDFLPCPFVRLHQRLRTLVSTPACNDNP